MNLKEPHKFRIGLLRVIRDYVSCDLRTHICYDIQIESDITGVAIVKDRTRKKLDPEYRSFL